MLFALARLLRHRTPLTASTPAARAGGAPARTLYAAALFAAISLLPAPFAAAQSTVSIHDIMTNLPNSPLLGQTVTTSAIVTGVVNATATGNSGFYITLASWDALVSTAEGIFVAGSSVSGCNSVSVGQVATITGVVTNSAAPNLTAADTPGTYLVPTACSVTGNPAAMSQTISVSSVLTTFGDALKYTGMAVSNASFYAVEPTTGTPANNGTTVTSTGQFWATLNSNSGTNNHLFRSAGIAGDEYKPASAPSGVPTWSGNPQRVLIDTTSFGGSPVDITVGQTITCVNNNTSGVGATRGIGLVDYTLGYARILIFKDVTCSVSGSVPTSVSAVADSTHFKVGTLDLNSFYNTSGAITTVSSSIFATRLAKAKLAVQNVFGSPDIMAVQEVQDQATLQQIGDAVNAASGTSYVALALAGNDSAGLNSGFLINTNTVTNKGVVQSGGSAEYTASTGAATLWDHPPLIFSGEFVRVGKNYPVTVINVHMTGRDNIDDSTLGPDIRARRAAQAAAVSALVQQYQTAGANVIVAGNLNAYEFNDGFVDVTGIIDGSPAAATAVTLYQPTSTTGALTDFAMSVPATSRYNSIERGNAATLEHILASATVTDATTAANPLASYVNVVTQPHFSTDYAATSANSSTTPAGLTPHDGFLVNFAIPPVPTTASIASTALAFGNVYVGDSKTLTDTVTNTTTFTSTVNITGISIAGANPGDFSTSSSCTAMAQNASCTISVTFAPAAAGARSATMTVSTDATSNPTFSVALTGTGLDTTASLTPASADFGNVIVGTTSAAKTFTWTNTESVALAISSVQASGDFAIGTTTCVGKIPANSSCTIAVTFTPAALHSRSGTLTVVSASSLNGTLNASLTGNGVADVEASADSLSFGSVDVGATSAAQTFTLTNYTGTAIALTGITTAGDFATASSCPTTLAGSSSCTVSVVFKPTATGVRTGSVVITTNDTKYPVITVTLSGNGVDFSIAIAPTSGTVIAGLSVSPTVTLTPLSGFSAPVTLSCTNLATGSTCSFAAATLTLSNTATDALMITTTSQYTVIGYGFAGLSACRRWPLALLAGLCALAALLPGRRRSVRAMRLLAAVLSLGVLTMGMGGCGNKTPAQNANYTTPGAYNIQVTATDGTVTHAATYQLTVRAK